MRDMETSGIAWLSPAIPVTERLLLLATGGLGAKVAQSALGG